MSINYQDQILQLAEAFTKDILIEHTIISKQQDPVIKKKMEDAVLPFVNNYLTDLYVQSEEIGFSDIEQISEFNSELDITLYTIALEAMGVIGSIDENEHFFLTDKGKLVAEDFINLKSEEE